MTTRQHLLLLRGLEERLKKELNNTIKKQIEDIISTEKESGVDFLYLPCGLNLELLNEYKNSNKVNLI